MDAIVKITAADKVGLVAAITGRLFDLGINIGDATFAVLGEGADFSALCTVPGTLALDRVGRDLAALPELEDATISVEPFRYGRVHSPEGRITHVVRVMGGDRPGLIARLSEAVEMFNANIVRLDTEVAPGSSGADDYKIAFELWIPESRAEACLATLRNTAEEMQLSCRIDPVGDD